MVAYVHVDVFADGPYRGNSLPVFVDPGELSTQQMLLIAQELRHFEAIFLRSTSDPSTWRARVFDLFGELPFAGHPIIGAAAVLHRLAGASDRRSWSMELHGRAVTVTTDSGTDGVAGVLDQGRPRFLGVAEDREGVADAFALTASDLRDELPLEVVSTGLRYLVVPVREGALERARVTCDLSDLLASFGAEYAVLLDESRCEIRHWNNDGIVEDIATGSAAGAVGAYRLAHALTAAGEAFSLHQGQFVGRPSVLTVRPEGAAGRVDSVFVGGAVAFVGHGALEVPR